MNRAAAASALWLLAGGITGAAWGQAVQRDPAASAPDAGCTQLLEALNRELSARRPEALLRASQLHETGQCVARNDARALEFLGEAARAGNALAVRRLSRRFALGLGVPQSYSNAGAWLAGKGASDEALQPWDYSIGYAYAVLSEVLATVQYPSGALRGATEAAFVIEINAQRARQVLLRPTGEGADGQAELYVALAAAFNARVPDVLKALPTPEPQLLVNARVAMPVALRFKGVGAIDVLEDEPILK
jgi:predicted TIM-barrel fold metal-dependent hydrolase